MQRTVVITVFGPDRPGLVEALSSATSEAGGNWLESRLLHLGGHFAGIVRIAVPDERHHALLDALRGLDAIGLQVVAHETEAAGTAAGTPATIEVVGHDRPGIVHEVSRVLAAHEVNVEELNTELSSAPMTGEPIFKATARVLVPAGFDPAALQEALERIAADLMVDLTFHAEG